MLGCLRIMLSLAAVTAVAASSSAHDDGRYADSPLKPWFESLRSNKGFCCAEADGHDTEYEIRASHYFVPVDGVWTEVPEDAVISVPNRAGRPILWLDPLHNIRCFIPGPGL